MLSWLRKAKIIPTPEPRDETVMLIKLIRMNRDWIKTRHYWYHPSGINMWIGNIDIGIGVKWGSTAPDDWAALSDGCWRALPYEEPLIKAAMDEHNAGVLDDTIQQVARKILKMYDDG